MQPVTVLARKLRDPTSDVAVITTYFAQRDSYKHAAAELAAQLLAGPEDSLLKDRVIAESTKTEKKASTMLLGELVAAHLLEAEGHLILLVNWSSKPFEVKTGIDVATVSPDGVVHYVESKFAGAQICTTPFLRAKLLKELKEQLDRDRMRLRFDSKTAAEGLLALSLALRQSPTDSKPAGLHLGRFGRLGTVISGSEPAWYPTPLPDAAPEDATIEFPVSLWHIEVEKADEVAHDLLVVEASAASQLSHD